MDGQSDPERTDVVMCVFVNVQFSWRSVVDSGGRSSHTCAVSTTLF